MKPEFINNVVAGALLLASGITAAMGHVEFAASLNGLGTLLIMRSHNN